MELPPLSDKLKALAGDLIAAGESEIPRVVVDAALPETLKVGPFVLQPTTFASLLYLHAAGSPFVTGRMVTADGILLDVATAVYILSETDWKKVRAEVEGETIGERVWETAAKLPAFSAEELQDKVAAIARHVNKGFATALPMAREGEQTGDTQKKMPASDGGSSSSPASASDTTEPTTT